MISKINQQTIDLSCTNAYASSNLYTGRLLVQTPLLSVGAGNFAFDVHLIYDSQFPENYIWNQGESTYLPFGWRLNVNQYLIYNEISTSDQSLNYFEYFDQLGFKHIFKYLKSNYFYDTSGLGLRLEMIGNEKRIIDGLGNIIIFGQNYMIDRVISGINSEIVKKYNYTENRLTSIYDIRKPQRAIHFIYKDNYLSEVKMSNNSHGYKISYNGNKLIKIDQYSKTTHKKHLGIGYQNGVLSYMLSGDLSYLKFQINSDMTRKLTTGIAALGESYKTDNVLHYLGDDSILGDDIYLGEREMSLDSSSVIFSSEGIKAHLDILYEDIYKRTVTNDKGVKMAYFFDGDGNLTSELEELTSNEYKSLFNPTGWQMHVPSVTTNFKINGRFGVDPNPIGGVFNIPNWLFNEFKNDIKDNIKYVNDFYFNLTFWIKFPSLDIYNLTITNTIYAKGDHSSSKVHMRNLKKNTLTYITMPIDITQFKKDDLGSMTIELSYPIEFQIFDVRVSPAIKNEIDISGADVLNLDSLLYKDSSNATQYLYFGVDEHFLTLQDIYATYKSIYQNKNSTTFELSMNGGTKIYEAKEIYIKDLNNIQKKLGIINGKPNLYNGTRRKISNDKWLIQESQIVFTSNHIEQNVLIDTVLSSTSKINLTTNIITNHNYYNGLPKYSKDLKNIIETYEYDAYGNLTKVTKHDELYLDSDENNEGKYIDTIYDYNGLVDVLRELPLSKTENGVKLTYEYKEPFMINESLSSNIKVKNVFDSYQNQITKTQLIHNNLVVDETIHSYDRFGLLNRSINGNGYKVQRNDSLTEMKHYLNNKLLLETEINDNQLIENTYHGTKNNIKISNFDNYERIKDVTIGSDTISFRYQDEGNIYPVGSEAYHQFDFTGSSYSAKITQIDDPYEICTYSYHYDKDNQMYSYDNGESNIPVEVKQINGEDTQYKYGIQKDVTKISTIKYDYSEMYQKLVKTNDMKEDSNNNPDDRYFEYNYIHDVLLSSKQPFIRLKGIYGSYKKNVIHHQQTEFVYKENSNDIDMQRTLLIWYQDEPTNNVVETSYSHNLNEIEISESISMELDIASSYGHTITDIADGSGKIYKSVNYTLDNLERVEEEVHSQLGTYEYEYLGSTNKLLKVKKNDAIIKTFNYVENRLRLFNDTIVSYDNYGNIIRLKNNTITYNDRNLMDSYGQNQYAYNHQNVRFKKQHENGYSLYYLDGSKMLAEYKYDLNDNLIHKYHYYYNALGIAGIEYNGKKYNYLTDGQGNISKVFFEGRMIGEYNYDSFGNDEINYLFPDDETERQLLRDNPFRWKSYYKDIETGFYLVNTASGSRYYDPEIGRFIVSEFDIINGEDILDNPVRVSQNYHNCYSNLQLYPSYDSYYSDNGNELEWWQWFVSGTQLGLGIGLMFVPGAQGIGAGLMVGGGIGLISNMLDPRIGQFIGGAGSIANGGGAISTGRSLLAFGPIGQTLGVGLMLIGAGTIIFGGNEIAASVTGDNYIQQWTGMSDSAYQGSYLGLNIASGVGQIAGNIGMRYVSNKILNSIANDPSTITNYSLSQIKTYGRYTNRWDVGTLKHGKSAGKGYTLHQVYDGRYIQWHPSGSTWHAIQNPYWKVSSGRLGKMWFDYITKLRFYP